MEKKEQIQIVVMILEMESESDSNNDGEASVRRSTITRGSRTARMAQEPLAEAAIPRCVDAGRRPAAGRPDQNRPVTIFG
jgi:hypothetical protein